MARRKRHKPYYKSLKLISVGKFDRALRNKRCVVLGRDEGNVTFKCGKQILVQDHVNNRHYRVTGNAAIYAGYAHKQRSR